MNSMGKEFNEVSDNVKMLEWVMQASQDMILVKKSCNVGDFSGS